jgi:hypothetical protein
MEQELPLNDDAIDSLVRFIRWGGDNKDPGASAKPVIDSAYVRFFVFLSDSNNCYRDSLVKSPDLTQNVDSMIPRMDVYDARQKTGPDEGGGRHAYLFADEFLIIFYVQAGREGFKFKRYDTLIVQKPFKVTGEK